MSSDRDTSCKVTASLSCPRRVPGRPDEVQCGQPLSPSRGVRSHNTLYKEDVGRGTQALPYATCGYTHARSCSVCRACVRAYALHNTLCRRLRACCTKGAYMVRSVCLAFVFPPFLQALRRCKQGFLFIFTMVAYHNVFTALKMSWGGIAWHVITRLQVLLLPSSET